jgi:methylthioribose-1-phosphate isomerase
MREEIIPIEWTENSLRLLDQRLLPHQEVWLSYDAAEQVADAIRDMVVRGAPAIGITAAFGVVLAARQAWLKAGEQWQQVIEEPLEKLAQSRPTAVNLVWAIDRMKGVITALPHDADPETTLLTEAKLIHQQDIEANKTMGVFGSKLLSFNSSVLTHCNAGALATGGFGTALGVIRQGYADGKIEQVYANETRPWLQGARLTAWELIEDNIPVILQSESAAASLMATGKLDWIIVGADRIAANGDVANKVGTYMLAILAKYHDVKMMVVAPTSTIDWQIEDGSQIPIEQRSEHEVKTINGQQIAPEQASASNPAFDVTPAELIDAIVTENGVVLSPTRETMATIKAK